MQYAKWIELTKKRGYIRSSKLKTLDKALSDYQSKKGTIQQLRAAFDAWIGTKPSQVKTIRNQNLDEQGLGPVQRLSRYICNEEGSTKALQTGVTHDVKTNVYLTDDGAYTEVNRKQVYEAIQVVKDSILAARESFQSGGFLSKADFDGVYQMWFGARDAARETKIKNNFDRLEKIVCKQAVNVHDDSGGHNFGHAYRGLNDQANIWLGDSFWNIPHDVNKRFDKMMDAKGGTAIHEFAHSILDAADEKLSDGKVCNSVARDRTLALQFPAKAINNADNIANYALDCMLIKTGRGRVQ